MPLPPLDQRSRADLSQELGHPANTYNVCAEIFGTTRSADATQALEAITAAQVVIHAELHSRTT